MDGVIINSVDMMYQLNIDRFPGSTKKDFEELFTGNIWKQIEHLKKTHQENLLSEEETKEVRRVYSENKTQNVQLYDGMFELLKSLNNERYPFLQTTILCNY